jgi:hypothetical protein
MTRLLIILLRLESIFDALALVVGPELKRLVGGAGRNPITGRPLTGDKNEEKKLGSFNLKEFGTLNWAD